MKSYISYFKLRFITNLQYRAAAIAGIGTQIFFGLIFIMVYLAFYESNNLSNLPMQWDELVTYIWLTQSFLALVFPYDTDYELLEMIKSGNLAYELIRPQNFFLKFYIKNIAKKITSTLLRCFPIIIFALLIPSPLHMSFPLTITHFIMFLLSLMTSCLLISAINILVHILTMFTIDSRGVLSIYNVICEILSGMVIPIPFFPNWLKTITNILPFRYICDLPFRIYSGSIRLNEGMKMLFGSLIWIIIFYLLGQFVSKKALNKAVIQGG